MIVTRGHLEVNCPFALQPTSPHSMTGIPQESHMAEYSGRGQVQGGNKGKTFHQSGHLSSPVDKIPANLFLSPGQVFGFSSL